MKNYTFLLCTLVFTSIVSAQTKETPSQPPDWDTLIDQYEGENLDLPNDPSLLLKSDIVVSEIDGLISKVLYLRSDKIQFRTMVLRNWQAVTSPSKAASYSILFVNRYEPELKVGLKLYKKTSIPTGFNEDAMLGLYAGFRSKYQNRKFEILMPPGTFQTGGYFSSLMNSPTYKTDIKYRNTGNPRTMFRNISYYFSADDYAIVACIEGPANLVEINKNTLESFLQNLSTYEPKG